jgi:D-aspartate ligase
VSHTAVRIPVDGRVVAAKPGPGSWAPPAGGRRAPAPPLAVVYPDNLAALGVCRGLGAQGVPVAVLSADRTGPGQYSRYARRVASPSMTEESAFVSFLIDFGREQRERPVLFLTDDSALVMTHRHRARLEEWYRFPLAPWPVLRRLMFKDELYPALENVVPVPRTLIPSDEGDLARAAEHVGFPALVKPILRCLSEALPAEPLPFDKIFGAKAIRVGGRAELEVAYRAARARGFRVVLQEEIEGPLSALISVGLYMARDGVVATFTSQKLGQVPAEFGDGLIVRAVHAPAVLPLAGRALRHFGYQGMADVEFKWDARARTYKLLDINPRPWLWINLPTVCGVNLPYAAYLDALGRSLDRSRFVQRDFRTRWVSARGLVISLVRSVLAGRPGAIVPTLLRDARRPRVGPLFSADDILFRMFFNPAYWWELLRNALQAIRCLRAVRLPES